MNLTDRFRLPVMDLSILLAIVVIGWAAYRLAKIEPQIASDRQKLQDLPDIFTECKELFRESIESPDRARRELDLAWNDALMLKAEYLGVARRLQSDLPGLESALAYLSAAKGNAELPRRMHDLRTWIEKQKDRAGIERLDVRSQELKRRIAAAQLSGTNGPVALDEDLGALAHEIDRTYENYLSDVREVTNNAGKPLVDAFVAQRLSQAKTNLDRLSDLARQAGRGAEVIESFLETQSHTETARRSRRQSEIIQAFLEAGTPAEFARRIRSESRTGLASSPAATLNVPSLRPSRYALVGALAGLGIILIVDLYWRTVVMPLRLKLVQRDTIITQQEKLAHFEQLAAGLAHEIRNPLTTINARLYTIQRKLPEGTAEHKDALVMASEIDRVNQILKDFIQLTRPTPPKLGLMTAEPLLREIRELMAPQLERQAVGLECQPFSRTQFYGDPHQLRQVLINLVQNAAQSIGREGAVILRARDESLPFKGTQTKMAIIEVEDNGPGIRPEVQGRLFEPFFSTRKGGTGLGLPISARIIDRHGGTLNFETQPGRGTVFRVALPAYEKK
jgi:signal transduction histidine kinase